MGVDYAWRLSFGQAWLRFYYLSGIIYLFESDGLFAVSDVSEVAQGISSELSFVYDDYEMIGDSLVQVFREDQESLIGRDLEVLVPLAAHQIYFDGSFWYEGFRGVLPPG